MTNTNELNYIIKESGFKKKFLAEACKITMQALGNKINNKSLFNAYEIKVLCELLNIDSDNRDRIFFA